MVLSVWVGLDSSGFPRQARDKLFDCGLRPSLRMTASVGMTASVAVTGGLSAVSGWLSAAVGWAALACLRSWASRLQAAIWRE